MAHGQPPSFLGFEPVLPLEYLSALRGSEVGLLIPSIDFCRAAAELGAAGEPFRARLEKLLEGERRTAGHEGSVLTGDLSSFNLAEVLQSFHQNRHTGTLAIQDGTWDAGERGEPALGPRVADASRATSKEMQVYFDRGDVFLFRAERAEDEVEFAEQFLEEEERGRVAETFGGDLVARGLLSEGELSAELMRQLKEEVYDVFFWEGARFEFRKDVLPAEFETAAAGVTKLSLDTRKFLIESAQRLADLDSIREVVPSEARVFEFASYGAKGQAIALHGSDAETLLLVDGAHSVADILRISGASRYATLKLVADLVRSGALRDVTGKSPEERQAEALERDLEGALEGEKFAEVLRALNRGRASGTMRVHAPDGRERTLCIVEGAIYLDPGDDALVTLAVERERAGRSLKAAARFGEVFLWPRARYSFERAKLPECLRGAQARHRDDLLLDADAFLHETLRGAAGRGAPAEPAGAAPSSAPAEASDAPESGSSAEETFDPESLGFG